MTCAVHPDVDATGYCRNCGKAMCSACVRPVRDVLYCEDCLAAITGVAAHTPPPAPASQPMPAAPARPGSNPAVAFMLGFFPGLGAVYNGEYNKALIHIVVFAAMVVGLSSDLGDGPTVALALTLTGFIFYMALDAMRTAQAKRLGAAPVDPLESWSKDRPIGPIILIVLGAFFLLNNFHWFPFYRLERLWPVILIIVGILMFRNRLSGRQ
jgi:hypothetical protein